ncbi:TetR/AcrR family transcriptional regulator [Streptomyces sp. NPDC058459]|uniref:TetR/AcrR family transcriptional regulator n=1 Tax=Streptomyces sp. NPDC058459 TaxID=3346508 RepID=UPI00365AFDA0
MEAVPGSRRRRRSGALTREQIIEAAVEISVAEGPGAVTFRALGSRVGVVASALYRYFADKNDLMVALGDHVLAEVAGRFGAVGDWESDLRQLASLTRDIARRHACTVAWPGHRDTCGPGGRAVASTALRLLLEAGLTPEQAHRHFVLLRRMVTGVLTAEAIGESQDSETRDSETRDSERRRRDDTALAALYTDIARDEPRLSGLPALVAEAAREDYYGLQLDLHIGAIRADATGNTVTGSAGGRD